MTLANFFDNLLRNLSSGEMTAWTVFGLAANACFASRFILQWYISERKRQSVVPLGFWYLSFVGGVMMLTKTLAGSAPRAGESAKLGRTPTIASTGSLIESFGLGGEARGDRQKEPLVGS